MLLKYGLSTSCQEESEHHRDAFELQAGLSHDDSYGTAFLEVNIDCVNT